jgi:hypothetical protein
MKYFLTVMRWIAQQLGSDLEIANHLLVTKVLALRSLSNLHIEKVGTWAKYSKTPKRIGKTVGSVYRHSGAKGLLGGEIFKKSSLSLQFCRSYSKADTSQCQLE